MSICRPNKFDDVIEDTDFSAKVGKLLGDLINYKNILPLQRALIPENHDMYTDSIFRDGSLSCESVTCYA